MDISKFLGIDKPIIQAPMAGVQNWELAVAVSEAGGLGSIPCGMLNQDQVLNEITQFKERSNKPYNLNFFCHEMPNIDQRQLADWQNVFSQHYEHYGVEAPKNISGLRVPFDGHIADAIEPHKPPIISFHFGLPSATLVNRIKSWSTIILSSATTIDEGIWLQENGADIVIAQGSEAGGHRGMFKTDDLSTQSSVSKLVGDLKQALSVPIIAAGGIATHLDVKRLFELGAQGVQVGTSFLLCNEANTSQLHRQALTDGTKQTEITNAFSGRPARGITNKLMEQVGYMSDKAPSFPYAALASAPLRKKAESLGVSDFTPLWSGQNRSGCKEVSARKLLEGLFVKNNIL